MAEAVDILIHISEQEYTQAKQSEDQRTNITGLIIIVASAIQGGLTQTGLNRNVLPLTITLILLGIFGGVAVEKLYERFQYHMMVEREIRKRLEELYPDTQLKTVRNTALERHKTEDVRWAQSIRLHIIWI